MAFEPAGESYEDEPYAPLTYQQTHPDVLAAIGALLGMAPAPVERCRVLDVGCASGANIIAMAEGLPGSEFTGVDLSVRQVEEGQALAKALGLANVSLRVGDILAVDPGELGTFDYIIAHGVYSWTPAEVRDALLAACRQLLAPQGIAFVSYNALPGWSSLRALREMMQYRTRGTGSQREQAAAAESLYRLLQQANPAESSSFGHFLAEYEAHVDGRHEVGLDRAASLLLHDELAAVNEPFYFHQFAEHAAAHGLQYLADADFPTVFGTRLSPAVRAEIASLARTPVEYQQYLDFVANASFKQTLLCHEDVPLNRRIGNAFEPLRKLFAASRARASAPQKGKSAHQFLGADGAKLAVTSPVAVAAMQTLAERFPVRVPVPDLVALARERTGAAAPPQEQAELEVAAVLTQAFTYSSSLAQVHATPGPFTMTPGERPWTPAFVRWQLASGSRTVTNLALERITLGPAHAALAALFDGKRTRDEAFARMAEAHRIGRAKAERMTTTLAEMALFLA